MFDWKHLLELIVMFLFMMSIVYFMLSLNLLSYVGYVILHIQNYLNSIEDKTFEYYGFTMTASWLVIS